MEFRLELPWHNAKHASYSEGRFHPKKSHILRMKSASPAHTGFSDSLTSSVASDAPIGPYKRIPSALHHSYFMCRCDSHRMHTIARIYAGKMLVGASYSYISFCLNIILGIWYFFIIYCDFLYFVVMISNSPKSQLRVVIYHINFFV